MPKDYPGFHTVGIRMPAELYARLEAIAKENQRSMSGEIVFRLLKSLKAEEKA